MPSEDSSKISTPISADFYKLNLDGIRETDFVSDLKYMSLQKFCFTTMFCLMDYICDKPNFHEDKMKLNRKQVSLKLKKVNFCLFLPLLSF